MFELSKQFRFDSAHTLDRNVPLDVKEASLRLHGHSYRAEVTVRGLPDANTGMVIDLDALERELKKLHDALDHRFLNDIPGLSAPTMENICLWIWQQLESTFHSLASVSVYRDSSGDKCTYNKTAGGK